jgi:hypothetical protein
MDFRRKQSDQLVGQGNPFTLKIFGHQETNWIQMKSVFLRIPAACIRIRRSEVPIRKVWMADAVGPFHQLFQTVFIARHLDINHHPREDGRHPAGGRCEHPTRSILESAMQGLWKSSSNDNVIPSFGQWSKMAHLRPARAGVIWGRGWIPVRPRLEGFKNWTEKGTFHSPSCGYAETLKIELQKVFLLEKQHSCWLEKANFALLHQDLFKGSMIGSTTFLQSVYPGKSQNTDQDFTNNDTSKHRFNVDLTTESISLFQIEYHQSDYKWH